MSTVIELFRAEGEARALSKMKKTLLKILSRMDTVPESLAEEINAITDIDELDRLTDLALDCDSLEEFTKNMP